MPLFWQILMLGEYQMTNEEFLADVEHESENFLRDRLVYLWDEPSELGAYLLDPATTGFLFIFAVNKYNIVNAPC